MVKNGFTFKLKYCQNITIPRDAFEICNGAADGPKQDEIVRLSKQKEANVFEIICGMAKLNTHSLLLHMSISVLHASFESHKEDLLRNQ